MVHWRLRKREDALERVPRLDGLMVDLRDDPGSWNRLFYEEARSLIEVTP